MSNRSNTRRRRIILTALLMSALMGPAMLPATADASTGFRIVDLGLGDNSVANAINDRGHVVGQRSGRPYLWRNGQITDLLPASELGNANDINNRDEVVGDRGGFAFLWRNGVLTDLGYGTATAINDRGEVVGWSGSHAFRWRAGVMTDLGVIPGDFSSSRAAGINNAGVVVGESGFMNPVPVRWPRNGTIQTLFETSANAVSINDRGDITGFYWCCKPGGFLLHRGELTEIPGPPGLMFFRPTAINNRTQIVGGTGWDAFYWQRGQLTLLPRLVSTSQARDINDRGQIVGSSGFDEMGLNYHAVLWTR